jgi:hypothetical protein
VNRAGFAGHAEVSHQENSSSSSSSNPVVTDIRTGRSTTLKAQDGSITRDGAQIAAGYDKFGLPTISDDSLAGDIVLSAQNGNISLNAATGTLRHQAKTRPTALALASAGSAARRLAAARLASMSPAPTARATTARRGSPITIVM